MTDDTPPADSTNRTSSTEPTDPTHSDANESNGSTESTEPDESDGSTEASESDDGHGSRFETLHPAVRVVTTLLVELLWLAGRLVVAGGRLAVSFLTERDRRIRAQRWFLLEGRRWAIVGGLVGGIVVVAFALSLTGVFGIDRSDFVTSIFTTVIAGLFSFVPIIVAVNQLTISQLFGTPDDLREQIHGIAAFRATIEDRLPDTAVSPTDPGRFAALANGVLSKRAAELERACTDVGDEALETRIERYARRVITATTRLDGRLDGDRLRLMEVLLPMMGDGYSENVNEARRIQAEYDDLPERADDLLADLRDLFVSMDVIRQYFKALYIKQELARLSRLIAYTGMAAFLVSLFLILLFANGVPAGGYGTGMLFAVSVALGVASLPFAVFFAFIVRIATIAKRTAAPGAFTPRGETPDYIEELRDSSGERP
ncbi:hypothetical protein [Halococcus hamelinensis]|uniref:Uncharacterized protein n=1 Tax=Halococcus hamelinensis 100A6 TaxID=1132509 RepID=M0M6E0_9EURY|nr:hypothetical protein [Halococcus hamelinensis]EMA41271.1 hypothetical protein C447_02462 [Halococcus hamelinensis 100A6]